MVTDYNQEAQSDARDTLENFLEEIAEQARDGEVSNDLLNDYSGGDSWHHEQHVDRDYNLLDAAKLLDALSDDEETDSGLWEGLEPRRAIAAQAAYTYGNAVYSRWRALIDELNGDYLEGEDSENKREGWARLFVLLTCFIGDNSDGSATMNLARAALEDVRGNGSTAGAQAFADWLEERGERKTLAAALRAAAKIADAAEEEAAINEDACPQCGSGSHEADPTGGEVYKMKCANCGHTWTLPIEA